MPSTDPVTLARYLRFTLEELSAQNGQFEFEQICQELIRARVASNVVTATGPVVAKGDQGRDAETFVSYLAKELGPHSAFLALVSEGTLAICCTLQANGLAAKFAGDAAKVVGSGQPVERIYSLCSTTVAVGVRHDIEKAASEAAGGVPVTVLDGKWIAEQLADTDLFWIAERFLAIDEAMRPTAPPSADGLEDWYVEARERWRESEEPRPLRADFYELRACLREAKEPGAARPDISLWLDRMERFVALELDDRDLEMQARYEIAVCTLIGKRDLRPADHHVATFFEQVISSSSPLRLLDAHTLLWFLYGMIGTGRSALTPDQVREWGDALRLRVGEMLDEDAPPTRRAFYRYLLGLMMLQIDPGTIQVPEGVQELPEIDVIRATVEPSSDPTIAEDMFDVAAAVSNWRILLDELPAGSLFPLERLAENVSMFAGVLASVDGWDELTSALDETLASSSGRAAAAEQAYKRSQQLATAGRPLDAITELHSAKIDWYGGDTLPQSVRALIALSGTYLELNLPPAAKQYALAGAYVASASDDEAVKALIPEALGEAARADLVAGNWLAAIRSALSAVAAASEHIPEFELAPDGSASDEMKVLASMITTVVSAARDLGDCFERALDPLFEGEAATLRALFDDVPRQSPEEWREYAAEAELIGLPFDDALRPFAVRFSALGVNWEISAADDGEASRLAAERFSAAASVLSVELAKFDLCLLDGPVRVRVAGEDRSGTDELDPERMLQPDEEGGVWNVLLGTGPDWFDNPGRVSGELFVAVISILTERSLLSPSRLKELVNEQLIEGVAGKLFAGRPFEDLVNGLLGDLPAVEAVCDTHWEEARGAPKVHPALAWRDGPGPTYDAERAQRDLESRYAKLIPPIQLTTPRLLAHEETAAHLWALREEGLLDWQIAQAILGVAVRNRSPEDIPEWSREKAEEFMLQAETEEMKPLPLELFTAERLREASDHGLVATLQVVDLGTNTPKPDFDAIRRLLVARYAYATDDVPHPDLLDG